MVTRKIERTAERIGDKILIRSNAEDEQSIGEFRSLYNEKKANINMSKDNIKTLKRQKEDIERRLKGKDMHLLNSVKKDVELVIIKGKIDEQIKSIEDTIKLGEKELAGISSVYEEVTKEEMERRATEKKKV